MKLHRILAWAVLAAAAPLAAQDAIIALNPTTMVGYSGTVAAGENARRSFGGEFSRRAPPVRATPAYFSYRPDPAVRQRIHQRIVALMAKSSPGEATKLGRILASGALNRAMATYLGQYGMSPNNLADTTALDLAVSWLATRGNDADPTRAQMQGLRAQVAASFAATPQFAHASDATKQELSEANMVDAALSANLANTGAKDPRIAALARRNVSQGIRSTYGIDLLALQLTPNGLR